MATYVINEWLPEDSSGANGRQKQAEALKVITSLAASNHQIVVIERSAFEQKFFSLCKNNSDRTIRGIARAYMMDLGFNLDRCVRLKLEETAPLPEALAAATKADDHYLLHAQLTVEGAILVTTDSTLCEAAKQANLGCISREEFLTVLN